MDKNTSHIDYSFIAKYFAGECTSAEVEQFELDLSKSDKLKHEVDQLRELWEASKEEPQSIDVDKAWNRISPQISETIPPIAQDKSSNKSRITWFGVAASIILIASISAVNWYLNQNPMMQFVTEQQVASIQLGDGSTISLDRSSKLDYPEQFDENSREVWLSGVGYFEVTSDAERPFIVHTETGDVQVVGTAFEVNTTESTSGKLQVEVNDGVVEVTDKSATLKSRVTKGQVCLLNTETNSIEVNDELDPAAFFWKDKTIKFRRTELKQVVQTLKDALNINVQLSSSNIEGCELTASFKDESADVILEVISTTLGLELKKDGSGYTLSGEGC